MFNIVADLELWQGNEGGRILIKDFTSLITEHWINLPAGLEIFPFIIGSMLAS